MINKGIRPSEQRGEITTQNNYPDDHSLIGSRTDILVTNSRKYSIVAIEAGRYGLLITYYPTSRRKKQE